ncbi:MAG: gamma-butyrobetaine hydroxylase-like domain-containing protein, partial [Micropepsaceae bacterium]
IGRYAVRLVFDDGHDTGLYSWDYLHKLGRDRIKLWFEYESRLKAAGLNREA